MAMVQECEILYPVNAQLWAPCLGQRNNAPFIQTVNLFMIMIVMTSHGLRWITNGDFA